MNEEHDQQLPPSEDRITEIIEDLRSVSPEDLDSQISARCAGDHDLEEAVRSMLQTRHGGAQPEKGDLESSGAAFEDDQAPTNAPGDFMEATLDLEVSSEESAGSGLGATIDMPIGDPAKRGAPEAPQQPSEFGHIPKSIAEFTVEKLLGTGGMGSVYLARQSHPERLVAVKVMKVGIRDDAAMQRFEFEIETLARLAHPSIAELYEAGVHHSADGDMPYVAMEYVLGARTITSYSKDVGLDVTGRLQLFRKACDGVGFGHARGVIHRDLKPPNILVDEDGDPKIIDFGVARAAEGDDALSGGQVVGTLRYMSPEQAAASGDIDTSTDVYALGLILYEMLTQRSAYLVRASSLEQARQIIEKAEIPLLSSTCPEIPGYVGDLDMICAKALEKDPAKRYRSANELSDDIQRYLDDEPVTARPPSTAETLRRISRKHKPVVAMIGVTIAVVIGALVAVSIFAVRANLARKEAVFQEGVARTALEQAETERARLQRLALVQGRMLATLDVAKIGRTLEKQISEGLFNTLVIEGVDTEAIQEALAIQQEFIRKFDPVDTAVAIIVEHMIEPTFRDLKLLLADDPQTDADIRELLGEMNQGLGRLEKAGELLERAYAIRLNSLGPSAPKTLRVKSKIGSLLFLQGRNLESKGIFEEVLASSEAQGVEDDPLVLQTLQNLGAVSAAMGEVEDAERYLSAAIAGLDRTNAENTWAVKGNLGFLKLQSGDVQSAQNLLSEAHAEAIRMHGAESIEAAKIGLNHADIYLATGDSARALELVSKSLDTYHSVRGRSHPLTANAMMARGTIYLQSGDLPSAKRDLREAWNVRSAGLGMDNKETLEALGLYSMTVAAQENYQEAIPLMVEFVDSSRRVLGKNDSRRIPALLNLGVSYYKTGQLEEAEGPLMELIAICVDAADTNPPQCQVAAPLLLTIYNELAVQFPDEDWSEKARLHKESF